MLLLGLSLACETDTVTQAAVTHPTQANAPPPDAVVLTEDSVPPGLDGERLALWLSARDGLRGARVVMEVGSEDEGPELFGEIQDARVDRQGRLWVLDRQASAVRVFAGDGSFLDGFGGAGDGPLEMRNTHGLQLLGGHRLAVYTARRQAKVFDRGPSEWRLEEIVTLPVSAEDNCSYLDRFFLHGVRPRADHTLFYGMAELGDTTLERYGTGYQHDVWQFRDNLSVGEIACVATHDRVVFGFQVLPWVRAYSVDTGDLVWSAFVDAYIQQRIETTPQGMRTYHGLPHDFLATALAMSSGHVVLQYRRYGDLLNLQAVRTFLLDPETGQGALIGDHLPEIESFHAGGYVASFADPYPRLEVKAFEQP